MNKFPQSIQALISEFNKLPGIGPKTSERFVFYLLKQSKADLDRLARTLSELKDRVKTCSLCYNFAETDPCPICHDSRRDHSTLCLVAESVDLEVIEQTGEYRGVYFVLGGVLNPIEGVTPHEIRTKELIERLKKARPREIILALNSDLEGESTILYLNKLLKPLKIKITRLARGLPMGSDLEYADEITLTSALKGRKEV